MPITIGIPFYNAERYLANAIRSIFAQTYQDWELILMDDGSTDGSLAIARSVQDERVRVISDGMNKRLPERLNQIVAEAKYDLVARMDADDMSSPRRLELQLPYFEDSRVQIVTTGLYTLTNSYEPIGISHKYPNNLTSLDFLRSRAIAHSTILARTDWFRRNQYDPNVSRVEDFELWCRAHASGELNAENIVFLNEPLYFYLAENSSGLGYSIKDTDSSRRAIIRKFGPTQLGRVGTQREILRSHIRCIAKMWCHLLGFDGLISRLARPTLTDPLIIQRAKSEILLVQNTAVPGLD